MSSTVVVRSVRDWDLNTRSKYLYTLPLKKPSSSSLSSSSIPPVHVHDSISIRIPSPSGRKLVLVKQETLPGDKKRQVLEIWDNVNSCLERKIVIDAKKQHGNIVNDPSGFGTPQWIQGNDDGSYIVYSAERTIGETSNYWDGTSNNSSNSRGGKKKTDKDDTSSSSSPDASSSSTTTTGASTTKVPIRGGKNVLGQGIIEGWGEQYVSQTTSIHDIYIVNVDTGKIGRVSNVPGGGNGDEDSGDTLPDGVTLGQASLMKKGNKYSVVYTGWDSGLLGDMPRRLGFKFCRNRPCKIYMSDVTNLIVNELSATANGGSSEEERSTTPPPPYVCLTPNRRISRSAKFLPSNDDDNNKNKLSVLFLSHPTPLGFESHEGCVGLYRTNIDVQSDVSEADIEELIPIISTPVTYDDSGNNVGPKVVGMGFPGIFAWDFEVSPPTEGSSGAGPCVYMTTIWGSLVKIIRVDNLSPSSSSATVKVSLLDIRSGYDNDKEEKCHSLLCVTPNGGLVVSESAPNLPPRVLHFSNDDILSNMKNDESSKYGTIQVKATSTVNEFQPMIATSFSSVSKEKKDTLLTSMSYKVVTLPEDMMPNVDGGVAMDIPVQSVLMLPENKDDPEKKYPLIVIPHGGPHSCSVASYNPGAAYLCSRGFAVLLPNYRGSIGFGEHGVESLLTRAGNLDVQDVMACTNHAMQTIESIDSNKVGICGGSHGGFLTGHCTGQYPDFFKAAVMRNPVTNIASMVTATDIADWCYVECLGTYGENWKQFKPPTMEQLQIMYSKSPAQYIEKVTTPTLIALGMKDLRVPPSQGLEWYHSLRSKKTADGKSAVPTKLLVYPDDNHSLSGVTTEPDHYIHIKQWFDKYLSY